MSLATWKKKYYPVPANKVAREQALAHSLKKWTGLRPDALKAHKLKLVGAQVVSPAADLGKLLRPGSGVIYASPFRIDADTCALCVHYLNSTKRCGKCPLAESLGHPCDADGKGGGHSLYQMFTGDAWVEGGDPEPMIAALEKAQRDQA